MPPVVAAVGALITTGSFVAAGAAFVVAGGWAAVGTFILTQAVLFGVSKLLAPKQRTPERQADTLQLSLSENPREAVFGLCATGGQLVDAWNHNSGTGEARINRAEVQVIKLADHEIQSLEGFYVNDEYHAFTGDGDVAAFVIAGFGWGLRVYFRSGAAGDTPPSFIVSNSGGLWTADKTMTGCAHVYVVYADTKERKIWPSGRPRFLWVVKGAKLYDPRKDSTVPGGSGAHRWGTPSTYEWSENAYLARYNYTRGFYNHGGATPQLMVGRGLTAVEAPPERAIARANICDEAVSLKAGGTEKRYRAAGVIKSSEPAIDVEEAFAAAMGGSIVDRDGVVDIDPGAAGIVPAELEITDADLLTGEPITFNQYLSENQRVNTVVASFVDPSQRWEAVSAPMRRDYADVLADGRPYEVTIDLRFVTSGTQAQRIAEIQRRQGRLEKTFQIPLGPRFIGTESNDWIGLTSDRYLLGARIEGAVTSVGLAADFRTTLTIRETDSTVFDWVAATDEITPGTLPAASAAAPDPIEVEGFTAAAETISTAAGDIPAILTGWDAFGDASVTGLSVQVRKLSETNIVTTEISDVGALAALITAGVGAQGDMQARAKAVSLTPGRECVWTAWVDVSTAGSAFDNDAVPASYNNLVHYSNFEKGTAGYSYYDPDSFTSKALSVGTTNGKSWLKVSATSPGTNKTLGLLQPTQFAFPVIANQKLACRCEYEATGAINYVYAALWFYTASNSLVSVTTIQLKTGTQSFGTELVDLDFLVPNNTTITKAAFAIFANCNSGAMTMTLTHPMVSTRRSDTAPMPDYVAGPNADNAADVTASNTAAAITGQGPLATESVPTYAGNAAAFAALGAGHLYRDSTDSNKAKTSYDPGLADLALYVQTPLFLAGASVSGTSWVQLNGVTTPALTGKTSVTCVLALAAPKTGDTMPTNGTMAFNWRVKSGSDVIATGTMSILQSPGDPPEVTALSTPDGSPVPLSSTSAQNLVIELQRVSGPADLDIYGTARARYE